MNRKSLVKAVLLFLVGYFFVLTQTIAADAKPRSDENKVIVIEPITNVDTIYDTYENNAFELMTKKKKQDLWTGVKEAITNASATIRTFVWSIARGLGAFSAVMVRTLFSMDIITATK